MSRPPARAGEAGLTLVEVLVALALFALIGAAGLTLLETVLRVGERTEGRIERLAEIDRALLVLRRDLAQMTPGPVELSNDLLTFPRAASDGALRQGVGLGDGILFRNLPVPDGGRINQHLLGGVEAARWRLFGPDREWHADWPMAGAEGAMPLAAELTLRIDRDTEAVADPEIVRLFALPEAARR